MEIPYQVGIGKFSDSFIHIFCSGFHLIWEVNDEDNQIKYAKKFTWGTQLYTGILQTTFYIDIRILEPVSEKLRLKRQYSPT